ncbi:DUF4845 domain-containing protein [Thiolapillus brandeum]|uniref:Conserved hypothetical transmembrane protein n=1 Tax=Thiolapillus brandeum TaxID=1076588 RepID=A0A7U6GI32_9GAMM|nr:DUF4845 domain-containing protein [Thiolapillus brandeum]BAO44056.1 conserved hypothetical transmembrane protein [Thiolapillus brandeum]
MQYLKKNQQGMSITTWIMLIAIALFLVLLGVRMVPSYMEYYSMAKIMESIKDDPQYRKAPPKQLRKIFNRRVNINAIYDFDQKYLKIDRSKGKTSMILDYEIRKPVAGNVSVLMHFHKEVDWK